MSTLYPADSEGDTRERAIEMDAAFQAAMLAAKRAGLESFEEGTFVDDTPLCPARFERAPIFSGMTSSAASCAEAAGMDGGMPRRETPTAGRGGT